MYTYCKNNLGVLIEACPLNKANMELGQVSSKFAVAKNGQVSSKFAAAKMVKLE